MTPSRASRPAARSDGGTLQTVDTSPIGFTDGGGSVVAMLQEVATYLVVGPFVAVLGGVAMAVILLLRQRARDRRRPRT